MINEKQKPGVSVIEILVVIFILIVALTSLFSLVSFSLAISNLIKQTNQADQIAKETMEAVRNFRDNTNWNLDGLGTLSENADYYPQKSGQPPKWELVPGSQTFNGFTRKVNFETIDPNRKKVTVTVFWQERGKNHQVKISTYLTNWKQ